MPAYIHGNLAVERKSEPPVRAPKPGNPVPRARSMPVQEKLLYLFTVAICVVVACVVIWRYAQIYEMNTRIYKIESQINQLEAENSRLKQEIDKLQSPQRLIDEAKKRGFQPIGENQIARIAGRE